MKDATRVIRAGLPEPEQGRPILPGPVFAGIYHLAGDPASSPYAYGRNHNPTWTAYEQAIRELDGGADTIVFASGMAAASALMGVCLKPGEALVMPADAYYTGRRVAEDYFAPYGIDVRLAPTRDDAQLAQLAGAKLLWLETPSNPGLDVCDIARLAEAAHQAGALVVVDNTTATCLGQQPLALGADFVLSSDTKATTGHSDLLLGHITTADPAWGEQLRTWRTRIGGIPGPMEVWLAHRSLATLDLRLNRQSQNALAIAAFLTEQPAVTDLRYPGLPTDPAYPIASRQMKHYGPIISFSLADQAAAERFLQNCRLVSEATSFGSIHTTAERRARWGGDKVAEGFIRFSVGCEDATDLIADLRQALASL